MRYTRHPRLWALALVIVAIAASESAAVLTPQPADATFAISHVRVFDGQRTYPNKHVVIGGGVIRAVADSLDEWPRIPVIDGSGATLLPGLIDAHTHTANATELQLALRFGVTTVLDMFTPPAVDRNLRAAASARRDVADFRSAGILATAPGGHGTEYGVEIPTVARAADADAFVADRKAAGADYIKIVLNGVRAVRDKIPTLDRSRSEALVRSAHARGMLVIAHIETTDDVRIAVESGVDGLAHVWRQGGAAPEIVQLVAARNVFVVPTLAVPDGFVAGSGTTLANDSRLRPYFSEETIARLTGRASGPVLENIESYLSVVRSLDAAGVRLLAGTDVPNAITVQGVSLHRELELLVRAGLTPTQALIAATGAAAKAFRLDDRGRIATGYRADLVMVRGDPTSDITATRDILRVWRAGAEFDRRERP